MVEFVSARLMVHVFQLHQDGPAAEELDPSCDTSAADHWMLPNGLCGCVCARGCVCVCVCVCCVK